MANGKDSQLVLFDLDGVIVDSFNVLYRNISGLFRKHVGKELSEDGYRALFEGNALANVLAGINASPVGFNEEDKQAAFVGYGNVGLFPGMKDALERFSSAHTVAIVTSTPSEFAADLIDTHGLADAVAAVIGPEVAVAKDERIRLAMQEFGATAANTWYVTDTTGDIAEAKKAGVRTVAVTWGFHTEAQLQSAAPAAVARKPDDLFSII